MKKIIALVALVFALIAGMTTVMTVEPQPRFADGSGCNTC
jgi:hypothetical protein